MRSLGALHGSTGDFAQAEPLLRQAVEIAGKAVGERHPKYAQALNSLGVLYYSMEDYARAEPVYRRALEIRKTVFGEEHPDYVASLNNLAELYRAMADYAKAEPLFKQALEIIARMGGEERPLYVTTLNNLALLHRSAGDYSEAKSLLQQVVEIGKKAYGEEHPRHATNLNNLAELHHLTGDYAGAETLYKRALMIHKLCLGDEHPLYANTLRNLGLLYNSVGDYSQAQSLCRQAVEITATHIDATAVALTERQQLAFAQRARRQLDSYVSCLVRLKNRDDQAYRTVLDWKGATLVRQRATRLVADQPELKPLFDNLQSATLRWATLARATMEPEKIHRWREQLADLAAEREELEAELSRSSAIYREGRQKVTLSDLRAVLPADAALVDFLEFNRHSWVELDVDGATAGRNRGEWRSERSLLAFVVRPGHEVRMFDLGPVAPLGDAIDTWRRTHGMSREAQRAGQLLRQKVWQPVQEALGEAGVVLVSPDGVLGRLPIGALPGKKPSTYLLEDHRLAMVAVPRLIPALLDDHDRKELDKELLLLGGVDYNQRKEPNELKPAAGPHRRRLPERRGEMRELTGELFWRELTGAAEEVALIGDLYQKLCDLKPEEVVKEIAELSGAQATESRFRDLAPKCYLLHLATHGFFCDPGNQSALASEVVAQVDHRLQAYPSDVRRETVCGRNPGLLSGLVFAGANDPPQIPDDPSRLEEVPDDGCLTAEEIAFLPLDGVRLVVLSACETGLGEVAGGEGLLGIQRAFQVSGARTTVASLWKVDDAATQTLMVEFYRNLWEKKLGKLEALRQAQLAMLNNYDPQEGALRSVYRRDKPRPTVEKSDRVPPRYWAAFVLSGDWR